VSYSSCKIYLSDEGFGHIVRQRAVVEELYKYIPDVKVSVQTKIQSAAAERFIPRASIIEKYNNITWDKKNNGSPDHEKIRMRFVDYKEKSTKFIDGELESMDASFLISDFVYEAFEVARLKSIPSFGVAHFTWDWFFSKLYPPVVSMQVIDYFMLLASQATKLYFPPFTPEEIIHYYGDKAVEVPLILKAGIEHKVTGYTSKFKVLIMDSGAGVLADSIVKALVSVANLDDFIFYVSDKFKCEQANVATIPSSELMVDYVADMNLVIGRAGFNTISECVGLRTPMLLIGEAMNPEMSENILMLKRQNLGSFISMNTFENELGKYLPVFLKHEYGHIKEVMNNHEIATNGAEVIVKDMLNYL
jgi:uncharacterized protein (TIGR00661 family)